MEHGVGGGGLRASANTWCSLLLPPHLPGRCSWKPTPHPLGLESTILHPPALLPLPPSTSGRVGKWGKAHIPPAPFTPGRGLGMNMGRFGIRCACTSQSLRAEYGSGCPRPGLSAPRGIWQVTCCDEGVSSTPGQCTQHILPWRLESLRVTCPSWLGRWHGKGRLTSWSGDSGWGLSCLWRSALTLFCIHLPEGV